MTRKTWWLGVMTPALAVLVAMAGSCGDDEDTGAGGAAPGDLKQTGEACTSGPECLGEVCLTDASFTALSEGKEANIPGGYCSSFTCHDFPEQCGPDGYCFDLVAYTDIPFWACFRLCDTESDCRPGYACTNAEGSSGEVEYPPLPEKACLPPDLLCLLDVRQYCEGEGGSGPGGSGGTSAGGSGGSSAGGSSAGGSSAGGSSSGGSGGG